MNFFRQAELKLTKVLINGLAIESLIDTGASCRIIRESIAKK